MARIPLKMRTLEWLHTNHNVTVEEIMKGLEPDYGQEGQFTQSNFEHMMKAMKAVGIVSVSSAELDELDHVHARYTITDYGVRSMKYIPEH